LVSDDEYKFVCPEYVHLEKSVECQLTLFFTFSHRINIDFGDNTTWSTWAIKSLNITKRYSDTGTYLIKAYLPEKNLTFTQSVQIHGKSSNFQCLKLLFN